MNSRQHVIEGTPLQSWDTKAKPPARYWAFYVRVTSEESVKKDLSIPNQCLRAIEIAKSRGWHDYRIYVEPVNVSAELWTDKRPAFKEMLDDVASGRILGICARHTDRLWRNNEVLGKLIGVIRPHAVELWDFNSRYEYKSAHGRFSLQVLGAASEKRASCQGISPDDAYRQACLEYPIGKTWYVHEDEALVVRLIFELYTSPQYRYGSKRIARHLNMAGYQRRTAGPFVHVAVMHILNNPVYAGYTSYDEAAYERRLPSKLPRHKQKLFEGEHLAIIDPELWHNAQEIKATESKISRMRTVHDGDGSTAKRFRSRESCNAQAAAAICMGSGQTGPIKTTKDIDTTFAAIATMAVLKRVRFDRFPRQPAKCRVDWLHEILASPEFVMEHVERLQRRLKAEQPDATKRLATFLKQRDALKGAIAKYFKAFETSPDPVRGLSQESKTLVRSWFTRHDSP